MLLGSEKNDFLEREGTEFNLENIKVIKSYNILFPFSLPYCVNSD